jgi:glutamate carboxypeptidase
MTAEETPRTFLIAHQAEMVGDLRTFVELESPSTDLDCLDHFAGFLADYARGRDGNVQIIEAPGGKKHIRVEWGAGEQAPVLLLGHFDTVWPVGTLESMPFKVDAGKACGPGSFDMKAGLVQGFWAVRVLRDVLQSDHRVVFLCTSDEEIGSATSRSLIESEAGKAAAVLVLEPSHQSALKTSRKGVGGFRIEVTGRSAHAGLEPDAGISAVDELARVILDLQALADPSVGSTVNVGVISGGTRSNVIAAKAEAEIDVRFSSQQEAERLSEAILGLQPHRAGIQLRVTGGVNRPPMERTPQIAALFERARVIAADLGFELGEASVGGGSDGNFCASLGVPVLDGLGAVGGGAHAPDEHVIVDTMPLRAALVAHLIATI